MGLAVLISLPRNGVITVDNDIRPGKVSMDHDPGRAIKFGYQVSANETSLSEAVYKFRSTELSIQDSFDLTVYRLRDIYLRACLACIFLISLATTIASGTHQASVVGRPFQS
jgi:hypothetical protein